MILTKQNFKSNGHTRYKYLIYNSKRKGTGMELYDSKDFFFLNIEMKTVSNPN